MRWTGTPPSQMVRLQPDNFRLDEPTPFVKATRACGGCSVAVSLAIRLAEPAGSFRKGSASY